MINPPTFEVENDLIKILSQRNPQQNEIIPLLQSEINWEYLLKTAEDHRVVPILFQQLKTNYKEHFPPSVYERLRVRFQEIASYNFARSAQLIKIVNILQNNNFSVLSYKGMTLAKLAYKDVTLRQFTDIDLLVKKQEFKKIKELMLSNGCAPVWNMTEKQEKAVLKYDYEFPFYCGKNKTLVEVHWDFIEHFFAFDYDTQKIWKRTETVELYGKNIRTLSPVDYLIVLSSHGSKHFWKRLSWICDIDRLVENTEIDWDLAIKRASETESLRMVLLGLYLSEKLLKTDLPSNIKKKISADENVEFLGELFSESLFQIEKEPFDWKEMARKHLKMREKYKTKIKYAQRLLTVKLVDKLFMPMGRPR